MVHATWLAVVIISKGKMEMPSSTSGNYCPCEKNLLPKGGKWGYAPNLFMGDVMDENKRNIIVTCPRAIEAIKEAEKLRDQETR